MDKRFKKIYRVIVFIMVIFLWLFSLYRIISYFGLVNRFSGLIRSASAVGNVCFSCPPEPPNPPFPPCPPCCYPTSTPTSEITPTPVPTNPPTAGDNGGGGGGPAEPSHCGSATPSTPFLRTLIRLGNGQVELVWDPVDPSSGYAISYGPKPGDYLYGVSDTGKVNSFIIGDLGGGNYCFAVRALNGCAPGELSNEKCTNDVLGTGIGGAVLGATGNSLDDYLISINKKANFGARSFSQSLPEKIDIDQVGIHLGITAGQINNNLWDISDSGASYLAGSGLPGDQGNMIIYGHNKNQLLGPIRWLEKGAKITITNNQGKIFKYQVVEIKTISPDQTDILSKTPDSTLILYTCTGVDDSQRFVVVAKLELGL